MEEASYKLLLPVCSASKTPTTSTENRYSNNGKGSDSLTQCLEKKSKLDKVSSRNSKGKRTELSRRRFERFFTLEPLLKLKLQKGK
jgi:hypothetical protein